MRQGCCSESARQRICTHLETGTVRLSNTSFLGRDIYLRRHTYTWKQRLQRGRETAIVRIKDEKEALNKTASVMCVLLENYQEKASKQKKGGEKA